MVLERVGGKEARAVLARLADGALGGVAPGLGLQFGSVEEDVGLTAQFVGDHGGLGADDGDHRHTHAAPLHREQEEGVPGRYGQAP